MVRQNLGNNVYQVWADGTQDTGKNRSNGNVYFQGKTIYSYGPHFPMGYRGERNGEPFYILNADGYSSTTSGHQSGVRSSVVGRNNIQIPFSILGVTSRGWSPFNRGRLDISLAEIEIVDTEPDREIYTGDRLTKHYGPMPTEANPNAWGESEPTMEPKYQHLLGRCVFRIHRDLIGFRYFLSGTDETMVNPWNGYFLAELPHSVKTVAEALESLKPNAVKFAESRGMDVKRQGEWFFIPCPEITALRNAANLSGLCLEHRDSERIRRHRPTQLKELNGVRFAKGTVRHIAQEHKMLKLGKVWHTIHENKEIQSFRAHGRVD